MFMDDLWEDDDFLDMLLAPDLLLFDYNTLDPEQDYLIVQNARSKELRDVAKKRLPKAHLNAKAHDLDPIARTLKENTTQLIFEQAGGYKSSGISNEEFAALMIETAMECDQKVIINNTDMIIMTGDKDLRDHIKEKYNENLMCRCISATEIATMSKKAQLAAYIKQASEDDFSALLKAALSETSTQPLPK